ncbi:MAG: ribbon-helix-helix domain-containing protein [Pseudomonadota bacterium]
MRETITISLPEEIKTALDEVMREEGLSRSELVREALREYLLVHRFRLLRQQMLPYAREQGIYTDQDVFDRIS